MPVWALAVEFVLCRERALVWHISPVEERLELTIQDQGGVAFGGWVPSSPRQRIMVLLVKVWVHHPRFALGLACSPWCEA